MKLTDKTIACLALTALLCACSSHKTVPAQVVHTTVSAPRVQAPPKTYYIPPPIMSSERTVADVLRVYGDYAAGKLAPYFAEAKVSYPPREVTFVALKQEKKLELWARDTGEFRFIRDYHIKAASGIAGPKLRQGDKQVPEGVYRIVGLNPNSNYHLSMKLNYPNAFDLFHAWDEGRTSPGSDIFIHGKAASIGCLAMGDEAIEELFVLTAHIGAENVKVVIAPHDPRVYPLEAYAEYLPSWTPDLYALITREIKALSPRVNAAGSFNRMR